MAANGDGSDWEYEYDLDETQVSLDFCISYVRLCSDHLTRCFHFSLHCFFLQNYLQPKNPSFFKTTILFPNTNMRTDMNIPGLLHRSESTRGNEDVWPQRRLRAS